MRLSHCAQPPHSLFGVFMQDRSLWNSWVRILPMKVFLFPKTSLTRDDNLDRASLHELIVSYLFRASLAFDRFSLQDCTTFAPWH